MESILGCRASGEGRERHIEAAAEAGEDEQDPSYVPTYIRKCQPRR